MTNVSSARLTAPAAASGEILRRRLVDVVSDSRKRFAYIHGGAGYGKTTLLSQIAAAENTVWLSLDGENDLFSFVEILCEAIRQAFPGYEFIVSEYLPFMGRDNFTTILANALLSSIEKLPADFVMVLDDLHTITEEPVRRLIACFTKYAPPNMRLCLGSREAPWPEFIPLRIRGNILELTQQELAFTRDEAAQILGFDDETIYGITEGWPLAIGSFKVLLENGVSLGDIPSRGNEALYSYLVYECTSRLTAEILDFLKASACFEELDPPMLDAVLDKRNSKLMLESLVSRNIFTVKSGAGYYRYHALFREYLLEAGGAAGSMLLQQKACRYYLDIQAYSKAAKYAMNLQNKEMLQEILLACYKGFLKTGTFSELRIWFQALGDISAAVPELLAAKGAFLSSIGNFTEAKTCLDAVIPVLSEADKELYIEAMIHKARVLRNFVSFEESNKLLDELMGKLDDLASETGYAVVIEKLYNLCWNSRVSEAYDMATRMIETCAEAGNLKVKAWFQRYLCAIHFFAGRMRESVFYYERSLELDENESRYLDMHSIGIYAAKAYQMLGDRNRSLSVISSELHKLRSTGKYEEMWSGYLFAAEIHYQNTFIDRMNGGDPSYETTMKYFTLADEYAPLYRKTELQLRWTKLQRLTYSLIFTSQPKEKLIAEIFSNLDQAGDYLKTIVLARLLGYFAAVSDFPNAVKCAKQCIEVGERANIMLHSTLSYGILARAALAEKDDEAATGLIRRYLKLCFENGILEYFRMRKAYDPILTFAFEEGIEPDITRQLMEFAGCRPKKAYIRTLGGFAVFPYRDREAPVKMRTKKERELLAFLLDAGAQGATKEQIYSAIWSESESKDIKRLIGVNLAQIKKDLAGLGIENPVLCQEKHYSIRRDEIECDSELFEAMAEAFQRTKGREEARELVALYKGEYLSDFEALWATAGRLKYAGIYEEALKAVGTVLSAL